MANNQLSYSLPVVETITASWDKVAGSKGTFWAAFGILFVIVLALGFVTSILENASPTLGGLFNIVVAIINLLLQVGVIYIGILRAKDLPISYTFVFRAFEMNLGWKIIAVYVLQTLIFLPVIILLMVLCPILLVTGSSLSHASCYVLGFLSALALIYLGIRMVLSIGYVLDQGVGPIDAIKNSFAATRGNVLNLIGVFILQTIIVAVSMIPLFIGLIWTLPLGLIIYGMFYKRLSSSSNA